MFKRHSIRLTAMAALVAAAGATQAQEITDWGRSPDMQPPSAGTSSSTVTREAVRAELQAARSAGWIDHGEAPYMQMQVGKAPMRSSVTRAEVVAEFKQARAEHRLQNDGEISATDQELKNQQAFNDRQVAQAEADAAAMAAAAAQPVADTSTAMPADTSAQPQAVDSGTAMPAADGQAQGLTTPTPLENDTAPAPVPPMAPAPTEDRMTPPAMPAGNMDGTAVDNESGAPTGDNDLPEPPQPAQPEAAQPQPMEQPAQPMQQPMQQPMEQQPLEAQPQQ